MSDILTSPPTHSPSPRRYRQQPRAIATREKILFVSAEMFNANGYAGAGINEMLDSSGLSKGALYFHFESKEAIAQSLIDQWRTFVDDLRCEVSSTETSALAQIVMLFRGACRSCERGSSTPSRTEAERRAGNHRIWRRISGMG